ncbi:hypothetical protein H9W90_04500 [Polaribacter pectinis]|uniref:DUF4350 domain-containing protein n=1 Tax=Polaribacter pectinis TaxID=2738844 RepID=A0A7G9LCP1_9FLAO|nr:DUF4350 domain-containing protein [Polaribacter pectinis]QNM86390.1 hypothetical protein H9W90_04500 [Polaribacter pectinis]
MKRFINIKTLAFLLVLLQLVSCNETNWNENYKEKEKSPFGNYIIYNEATTLLETEKVVLLNENIYDYLFHNYNERADYGSYICIKNSAYKLTDDGIDNLLRFIHNGNDAFIAVNYFSDSLKEKLGFTTNNLDKNASTVAELRELKGEFTLENNQFANKTYNFDRNIRRHYFLEYNENSTIVLGTTKIDGEQVPNFIKVYHGKGALYLHTNPVVFTNYNMLNGKEAYAANVLSYVSNKSILWDPHIKSSKFANKKDDNNSVFKFFLEHKTLTWFLFVSLAGVLLFMLFNARRKQRPIPIKEPLKNTTVAFTQTIANLYLKEQDHKNLVDKKIAFFLEKVRTKYLINTASLNSSFIEKLAAKSGNELQKTKYLIHTIIALNKKDDCSEEELIVLHKMIDNFFNK